MIATRRITARTIALFACTMLLGACQDPLAPRDVVGTYALRTLTTFSTATDTYLIVADTMVLRADRTAVRRTVVTRTIVGGAGPVTDVHEANFSYRTDTRGVGLRLRCTDICPAFPGTTSWFDLNEDFLASRDGYRTVYQRTGDAPSL